LLGLLHENAVNATNDSFLFAQQKNKYIVFNVQEKVFLKGFCLAWLDNFRIISYIGHHLASQNLIIKKLE
jgi:hypothetical protein